MDFLIETSLSKLLSYSQGLEEIKIQFRIHQLVLGILRQACVIISLGASKAVQLQRRSFMLYLVKSSRFREYQQENLHILTARRGITTTVRYRHLWIDPHVHEKDIIGVTALMLFGDLPYEYLAPVRLGRVVGVYDERDRVELEIMMGGFPSPDTDMAGFSSWFRTRTSGEDKKFVFWDESGPEISEQTDPGQLLLAWKASVRRLLRSDSAEQFSDSVFILPLDLRDEENKSTVESNALITGRAYSQRLYSYNPHMKARDLARKELGLAFDRTELELLDHGNKLELDGQLEVRFRLLLAGSSNLNIFVRPGLERSSRMSIHLHAAGDSISCTAACQSVTDESREQLRGLLALLKKWGSLKNEQLEGLVLERLLALAPDDPELMREQARYHYRLGRYSEAEQLFAELGPGQLAPDDWLPYFLSACNSRCDKEALLDIVSNIPWDDLDASQAKEMGICLSTMQESTIVSLLETLAYFGTERFIQDIWQEIKASISSPKGILTTYRIMKETHLDSPAQLYGYLSEQMETEGIMEPEFDQLLVQNALQMDRAPSGFDSICLRHLKRLVDSEQYEKALSILEQARKTMSVAAFGRVRIDLADVLSGTQKTRALSTAGRLFADAADAARVRGDLDEAAMWLERSAMADPEGERFEQVRALMEKAVDASEKVMMLTDALFASRMKKLRDAMSGKKLTIVGGPHQKPWVEDLRKELALGSIQWFVSDLGKRPRADKIRDAMGKSTGAVAILTFHVGHQAVDAVKEEARKKNIPYAPVLTGTSKNALVQALIRAVLE